MEQVHFISSYTDTNMVANAFMNAYFNASDEIELIPRLVENSEGIPLGKVYQDKARECDSDIIILSHHDVLMQEAGWDKKVREALKEYDVIGVAGTKYYEFTWPNWWNDKKNPDLLAGAVMHTDGKKTWETVFNRVEGIQEVCLLDGLLYFCRKSIFEEDLFDYETFDKFHWYDMDFCVNCLDKGFKLGVIELKVLHLSLGIMPPNWYYYQRLFQEKHEGRESIGEKN